MNNKQLTQEQEDKALRTQAKALMTTGVIIIIPCCISLSVPHLMINKFLIMIAIPMSLICIALAFLNYNHLNNTKTPR